MKKEQFDKLFDENFEEAVKKAYKPITPPDSRNSFIKVRRAMLQQQRRRVWRQRIMLVAASVFLMFFGAIAFGDLKTNAFTPVYNIFQNVKDDVIGFFITTDNEQSTVAKTPPPTDDKYEGESGVSIRKQVSLEEANAEMSFKFYIPEVEGYELKRTEIFFEVNKKTADMIDLWYEGINTERSFGILQTLLPDNVTLSAGIHPSSGVTKEVTVLDSPALLISFVDGRSKLRVLFNNILVDISGNFDEEEILSIAESLK